MKLTRKLTLSLAAIVLLAGMTGIALAADGAAPGDSLFGVDLHGIDLALEQVGIGDGGVAERLAEASALADNGNASEALAHAAAAIANAGADEEALAGLETAIAALSEDLPEDASDNAVAVRGNVLHMLQWMFDNSDMIGNPDAEPGAFGKGVAGLASNISPQSADTEEAGGDGGPPEGVPGGPPESVPTGRP